MAIIKAKTMNKAPATGSSGGSAVAYPQVPTTGNQLFDSMNSYSTAVSQANSAQSQANAREQMAFQTAANAKAMQFSADQAEKNRDWEEKMSSSAHQREVMDLIKAGLNPVLSAMNGNGASTPSGSSPSGTSSGGASGNVDSSSMQILGTMLGAIISQATALQTTAMSNKTALDAQQMSVLGMLGTANINSKTQYGIQAQQQKFDEYLKQKYPQNTVGGISAIVNGLNGMATGDYDAKTQAKIQQLMHNVITGWGLLKE